MRTFYSFLLALATPWLYLRLYWKGRRMPAYRTRIAERFARAPLPVTGPDVWVHAVSLGEVIAAIPLLDGLLASGKRLLVTTMTPTGAERLKARFGDRIPHVYIPYDLRAPMRRFVQTLKPRMLLIMETELWPNLLAETAALGAPIVLANARLSTHSFHNYERFRWFFKPLLQHFHTILAQSPEDARRFLALGAPDSAVQVGGNVKFDLQIPEAVDRGFEALKARLGESRVTLIAASTHPTEEAMVLSAWPVLKAAVPGALLMIAPRHPERFQEVYALCQKMGYRAGLRSQPDTLNPSCEVVVLDSLGELLGWYALSDYAFVGGSFVQVGGHNVLEPVALGVPAFSGPIVFNFTAICEGLREAGGLVITEDAQALMKAVIRLHAQPEARASLVANATRVFESNRGSVKRHLALVDSLQ